MAIDPHHIRIGAPHAATLFASARHKALYGGRGSGKSYAVATYLVITATRSRKRIVCARQFQNSIRDSSKELCEKRIQALGMERAFDVTEREIVHKHTGTQFIFIGLDRNVDSIRSLEGADVIWTEEARTISARSMEILLPTIRKQGSELIWTWNPEQPTDPVDAYFRASSPPPRSIVTRVSYVDNPFFFTAEMLHEMEVLRQRNPDRFKHIWLGAYDTRYELKVFPNTSTGRVEVPANCPPRYGLDFGFGADPSFVVKLYVLERSKQIYIAAEASGRASMDQLPALIRSVVRNDGDLIKADSSQPGTIEFLNSRGINVVGARKGQGSVQTGIQFLQGYEIVIDPNCAEMRDEARYYSWSVDRLTNQVLPGNPVDAFNHGWDACIAEGSPVATVHGDVPIEDVKVGDPVLTRRGYCPVAQAVFVGRRDVVEICAGGQVLRATPDHRVWTENRGFVRADALRYGDELLFTATSFAAMPANGQPAGSTTRIEDAPSAGPRSELTNILQRRFVCAPVQRVRFTGTENVYDLSVDGVPEFFASGILVHNCRYAVEDLIFAPEISEDDRDGGVFELKLWR